MPPTLFWLRIKRAYHLRQVDRQKAHLADLKQAQRDIALSIQYAAAYRDHHAIQATDAELALRTLSGGAAS